jgi:Holliday junction resolvase RusA-like endonuclease
MTSPLTVVLLGQPVAWARTRIGQHGLFTPPLQRNTSAALRMVAQDAMQRLDISTYTEPVCVTLLAEFAIPASWSKKKRAAALLGMARPGRPDIDNVFKLLADSFNRLVWADDALVAELHAQKRYGLEPKIVATVRPILREARPAELPLAEAAE